MREGTMDPSGAGLTRAGKILGIIAVCLQSAVILLYCAIVIAALSGAFD